MLQVHILNGTCLQRKKKVSCGSVLGMFHSCDIQFKEDQMIGTDDMCLQTSGGKTRRVETTWKAYTYGRVMVKLI
jgi:hypothetical protein